MLRIRTLVVTPFEQNARIVVDEATGESLVLDPGGDLGALTAALQQSEASVRYVVLTHAHMDHGGKVQRLLEYLQHKGNSSVKLVAHEAERTMRRHLTEQPAMFGFMSAEYDNVGEPDILAVDGMTLALGAQAAVLFHTPGHSPGHIVLYFERTPYVMEETEWQPEEMGEAPLLFAGDVLFAGSIGRTDLPGGNMDQLLGSIEQKLLPLPDDTIVLSGHGPNTTIGQEKKNNPFLKLRSGQR